MIRAGARIGHSRMSFPYFQPARMAKFFKISFPIDSFQSSTSKFAFVQRRERSSYGPMIKFNKFPYIIYLDTGTELRDGLEKIIPN